MKELGWNANKRGCMKCEYGKFLGGKGKTNNTPDHVYCDYISITGQSRMLICSGDDCTVYRPAKRQKKLSDRAENVTN